MSGAASVTDFGAFASMRLQARANDPQALRQTAQQFEGLMLQQMLKSMRAASLGDDVMGGEQMGFYQEQFDAQMAQHLAASGGLGLADALVRQMQRGLGAAERSGEADAATPDKPLAMPGTAPAMGPMTGAFDRPPLAFSTQPAPAHAMPSAPVTGTRAAAVDAAAAPLPAASITAPVPLPVTDLSPNRASDRSPVERFVDTVRPYAERAAKALGVSPQVLIAQAALETGWGRRGLATDGVTPANNLFGIKADRSWGGPRSEHWTQEFENGAMQRQRANFRAYPSLEAAFNDYVGFLRGNPRYHGALAHGGDSRRFVEGIAQAGYATDPDYAQKIMRIANSPQLRAALSAP